MKALPRLPSVKYYSSLQIIDLVWNRPNMKNIMTVLTGLCNLKRCRPSGTVDSKELDGNLRYHLITKSCSNFPRMIVNMLIWTRTERGQVQTNFNEDRFFLKLINFKLNSSTREEELLTLILKRRVVDLKRSYILGLFSMRKILHRYFIVRMSAFPFPSIPLEQNSYYVF
jgi:hypothetical protein